MNSDDVSEQSLLKRVNSGDESALAEVFAGYRDRLRRMIDFRLDARMRGRLDASDVLQDCFLDLVKQLPSYQKRSESMSVFVWMRLVAKDRLVQLYRREVGAKKRSTNREVSANQGDGSSMILARHLVGQFTSAGDKAIRAEMQTLLMTTLEQMEEVDREIIMMRCFEEMSNMEVAETLNLSVNGASSRFVRAMTRLRAALGSVPGFMD